MWDKNRLPWLFTLKRRTNTNTYYIIVYRKPKKESKQLKFIYLFLITTKQRYDPNTILIHPYL